MIKAYSYIRFSSAKQAGGDSLRRQMELSHAYAQEHGLELSELSYRDLGVSGYDKSNIERGALSAFVKTVEAGKVAEGSYLLVEQFDRLSRAQVSDALTLLLKLVKAGVVVVTLTDGKRWDRDTVNDVGDLIMSIVYMSRAHNESDSKSKRMRSVWGQKQHGAVKELTVMTSECPRWLRMKPARDGFDVIEDKATSVRKVFEERIKGFGASAISRRANQEKWPCPGKGDEWYTSLVGRLLENRAVLGEYLPRKVRDGVRLVESDLGPAVGYYPSIISPRTFELAHAVSARRGPFPGRRDLNYKNFLQGLLHCECGRSFVRKNKQSTKQPGYARYYCSGRYGGVTKCEAVGATVLEPILLQAVADYAPDRFLIDARAVKLREDIELLDSRLSDAQHRSERLTEAIAATTTSLPTLIKKLEAEETTANKLKQAIASVRAELAAFDSTGSASALVALARLSHESASIDDRAELRESLARLISSCVVHAQDGYLSIRFRGDETVPVTVLLRPDANVPGISIRQFETQAEADNYDWASTLAEMRRNAN